MSAGSVALRPFNALSGTEIKKIILAEISNYLEADCRFRQHVTYPVVSWRWKLAVNAYPMEPGKFEVEVGPKVVKAPEAAPLTEGAPFVEIDISGGRTVAAPAEGQTADEARRGSGIPVPTPRAVPGPEGKRMLVDAPVVGPGTAATEAPVETRQAEANVERGGKVFGRSVALRTNANPTGVEASPQGGTRPGAEEIQEILKREGGAPQE